MKKENRIYSLFVLNKSMITSNSLKAFASIIIVCCLLSNRSFGQIQEIDLLLKGGHVIDPKNKIDSKMDVAIIQGKIFKVAPNIPSNAAKKVIEVNNLFITPGLIDLHTHVFAGSKPGFADGSSSVTADNFTFRSGITTVVDAGTAGWRNLAAFKEQIVDRSKTRVLSFLNAFGAGMIGSPGEEDINDMDFEEISKAVKRYPEIIVGMCIGHYRGGDWAIFEKAAGDARTLNLPLFVECHIKNLSLEGQLNRMRSGDILTHCFEKVKERDPLIDENGKVQVYVTKAREKGILFDIGHGGSGFWFSQAIPAMKEGFFPDSFGTDMHHNSVNAGMKDMLNIMSKFLNMGMSLQDIIMRATWKPAKSINREDLGQLSPGAVADITVFGIKEGNFGFVDSGGNKLEGNRKLEVEVTIREGKIVWDLNGISAQKYKL